MKYRIETTGDGAGTQIIDGEWSDVVKAVAASMYSPATPDDELEVFEMLRDGIDDGEGWDGNSVCLSFEDGMLSVTLLDEVAVD